MSDRNTVKTVAKLMLLLNCSEITWLKAANVMSGNGVGVMEAADAIGSKLQMNIAIAHLLRKALSAIHKQILSRIHTDEMASELWD